MSIGHSVTRNENVLRNPRSSSTDIFYKPHEMGNFWSSMSKMQTVNQWNHNYSPAASQTHSRSNSQNRLAIGGGVNTSQAAGAWGAGRSTTSSLSGGRN